MILTEATLGVAGDFTFLQITYTGMFLTDGLANVAMGRDRLVALLTSQTAFNNGLWPDSVQYNVKK